MDELKDYVRNNVYNGESFLVIGLNDLEEMLTRVFVNAIARYESIMSPKNDRIKQSEAKRYIVSRGFKPCELKKWVDEGLIHAEKPNESQNGAVWYSRAEIENTITSIGTMQVVVKDAFFRIDAKI